MIAVDSSVWIDLLRDKITPQVKLVFELGKDQVIAIPDLVITEVLQGSVTHRAFDRGRWLLSLFPTLTVVSGGVPLAAARNYRELRKRGITIRSTIDTLIATRCILDGHELLHNDRDFDGFEQHLGLRVVRRPAVY